MAEGGGSAAGCGPGWPTPQGLRRTRLLDVLARPARLTVVIAPAGSGKTTLLAQHAAAIRPAALWYRASPLDVDPFRLVNGLLREAGFSDESAPAELPALLDTLAAGPLTLIIDDAHLLIDSPAEDTLDRMLTDGPPGLSVILGSRRAPGLNLCRAELGTVQVIVADDLRFRSWEVESLFRDHYRAPLPPDDAAALTRHTEGWAACLRLFHLSTQARPLPERRRAVAALTGGPRYARAYLARTILHELPAELREFLARTAVFEVLTGERCDRLLDTTGSQARLEQLVRLEALTTTDDGGRTFRYHEVFRRHLESALLDELGAERTRAWYEQAARMLRKQGAFGEAMRMFLRAERWDEVTRLLQEGGPRAIDADPDRLWHELLPPEMVDEDPWLSTAVARRLTGEGRLREASRRYRRAEELFPDPSDRERVAHERRLVELWTIGRPRPHLHWLDRLCVAVRAPARLELRDPRRSHPRHTGPTRPGDRLADSVGMLLAGNVLDAAPAVAALLEDPEVDGLVLLAAQLVKACVDALRGADVSLTADRVASDAERVGAAWIARQARVLHAACARDQEQLAQIAGQCGALGDLWGELLAEGALTLRSLLAARPAVEHSRTLLVRTRAVEAGALEAWATALGALAAAAAGDPLAGTMATGADAFGRARGVWGVQALTALAHATTRPTGGDPAAPARALAARHGLPWSDTLEARVMARPATAPFPSAPDPAPAATLAAVASAVPAGEAGVRVRCFGGFEIHVADRSVDLRGVRPRAASALRLLASRAPQPVHREVLLELWPGLPPAQARHSLQVAISSLRSLLVPDGPGRSARMIERIGETYALMLPPASTVDLLEVDSVLRAAAGARRDGTADAEVAALEHAVAGYRGELLPEEGPSEWVLPDRERWRLRLASACARLAELHLASDSPRSRLGAIEAARRGVGIDPFSDALWRALISGYTRTGDAAAAARARRDYADVLHELGLTSRIPGPA